MRASGWAGLALIASLIGGVTAFGYNMIVSAPQAETPVVITFTPTHRGGAGSVAEIEVASSTPSARWESVRAEVAGAPEGSLLALPHEGLVRGGDRVVLTMPHPPTGVITIALHDIASGRMVGVAAVR